MTPFEVLYGRKPPSLTRYLRGSTPNVTLEEQLLERDNVLALLKMNLSKAQFRMKLAVDKHLRDVQFEIDDWVFVKLQSYRQGSARLERHLKLGHHYFGPYKVLSKIGSVAYKLDLPTTAKIHPIFHVSLLRKCLGKPIHQITPLHLVDSMSTIILQPQAIRQKRSVLKVEDKVGLNGGGIVMSPTERSNQPNSSGTQTNGPTQLRRSERVTNQPTKYHDFIISATSASA
ncbi:putative nucleotidyltransferase, Ribonuclease H [Helianthus annuus]|nr:putative nucleotidyltransferase, Ribonuclease H [Helianthus annuus]